MILSNSEMVTHFSNSDLCFIFSGFVLVLGALVAFAKRKHKLALILLFFGGFVLRLWMAFIDPFINMWDEQFHAQVARNLMQHPFYPTLYESPALPFQAEDWYMNHVWVHKPPLFLWQIALAFKIFGIKYWAVRIPSVLLSSLCIPVIFRIGKLMSGVRTGFFSALIFTVVSLQINVVSGFLNTDHNDVIFMCYVLFSFWAWIEFYFTQLRKWIFWIGIFTGLAILVKWLPGLLVFGAWFICLASDRNARFSICKWKEMFFAFLITILLAAPWFIYVGIKFPAESKATFILQYRHLDEALDHAGPWWYHFELLKIDYGWWMVLLLPIGVFLFLRNKENRFLRIGIVGALCFVYLFYSLVKTRMPLFCLMVGPLIYLLLGEMVGKIQGIIQKKYFQLGLYLILAFFVYLIFDSGKMESVHTNRDPAYVYRNARIENKKLFEQAAASLPSKDIVIFNCGGHVNGVACMFYTGFTSYNGFPDELQFKKIKSEGIRMAVFDDIAIPEYLQNDNSVIKLHFKLIRNGF